MLIKRPDDCREIVAVDRTRLRELLHPKRDPTTIRYSLASARLDPGQCSLPHRLDQTEVYYFTAGSGVVHVGGEAGRVMSGDAVCVPGGEVQWLENDGPGELVFVCIVDPAWTADGERLVE